MKVFLTFILTILLMIFFKCSVLWIVTHCSALAVGYFIIACLINYSDGELLWNFFENWLGEKLVPNETNVRNMDVKNNSKRIHDLPWKGVTIPEPVNKLLEELIEQLIDNYVNSWYKTKISGDASFVNEIRYQIRYAVAVLYLRFQKIDLSSTILFEAVPLAAIHCSRVKHLSAMIDKNISSSQLVETKILEAMPDVHFALSSRENEVDYLRELADHLIGLIMDESCIAGHSSDNDSPFRDILTNHSRPWASHVCRHFLRELFVFSFLLPAMDLIADPDIINRLLVFLCDSDVLSSPNISQGSRQVEILHQLTDYSLTDTPDSLLQLKLSDMLRDTRQLMMFRAYLKDIHAPLNELDFLVHAGDAHGRMLNVQNDHIAMSELQYDIWELFVKYIHDSAPDRINLPVEIICEFSKAVENHDYELLDRCLEKAFQIVYKRMQHEYVIPFCQSECFFSNLCGPRPVGIDELITSNKHSKSTRSLLPAVDANYSLSQFRNRLWRMLFPVNRSVDPSFNHFSDVESSEMNRAIEPTDDITQGLNSISPRDGTSLRTPTFELVLNNGKENTTEMQDDQLISNMLDEELEQHTNSNNFEIPLFDPGRDMNKWNVTIPRVEPRRDPVDGHTMYVYVVFIERFDINDDSDQTPLSAAEAPQKWTVIRHYNEFYILESKLIEFHGNTIKTESLPPRRFFNCKSRVYVESRREYFERFIQLLTKQRALKQSDLLFVFLSTEQRFKDSTQISDLYPWNMVKKMPSKFARERGQNLKPFILSLLATTLIPQSRNSNESNTVSSINPEVAKQTRNRLQSDIYGDNCPSAQIDFSLTQTTLWTKSFCDAVLFILNRLFGVVRWPLWIIVIIRHLMGNTIDAVAAVLFRRFLNKIFVEFNCIRMLRFIQDSIFGINNPSKSDQEKMLRMELAQHLTLEYLQEQLPIYFIKLIGHKQFRKGILTIFHILQYPRLNKQLAYGMRIYDCFQHLPYAFEQVATVFWHRYPNTTAKHVISEDFIDVAVEGDQIKTKKLIMKQTGTFLKAVPKWMSRLTNARVVPTVEESIFDRRKRSLVTYTRNITMLSTCKIHERCVFCIRMKYPSVSLSWKHEETLQLFELMETEDEWLIRTKKLAEIFGDERPAGFFTEEMCKNEFERVMSSGHPEHFLRKPGEKYSRKELIHAWTVYLKKELKIKKAQEEELLLVKLRQKADLFNRLFSSNSDLTDKDIEKLLEEAREEDSMRDQEVVRKEIEVGTKNLKEYLALHETNPVKYPQLKIVIPPSHPPQSSANEAPFSPIKPLFEGFSFQSQKISQTKASSVANTSSGSSLSRKVSSPQCRSTSSEILPNETLDDIEMPSSTQGRLRTLSVSSRTQGWIGNNASPRQTAINSESLTSQPVSSESVLRLSSSSADEIQTSTSETPDEAKLHHIIVKNEMEEEVSSTMEEATEKKETVKTRRTQKIVTRSSGNSNNMDNEATSSVQHEHSLRNRRFPVASTSLLKNVASAKISGSTNKEEKNVAEEEEEEGKLRRSERCHAKIDVEASVSTTNAQSVQTGRRKRSAKLEIVGNNEEEVKALPVKRRRLNSRDVENAERKDMKHRIESNIELQSSPEPDKEINVQEKQVVDEESDDDKKLVDLRTRSRASKAAIVTNEKAKEKTGTSSESSSARSLKRSAVMTRSSRRQSRRGASIDGDVEQKALMVTAWRMVSSHRHAAIFAHPVSDRDARGYSKIVKNRMDLSTLKKQLDGGSLSGMSDFKRNVLLMFANAVMFNSTGHDVNHYAKEMAVDTLSSLKMLQKDVLFVRGTTHMTRRSAAFAAEEAKFERSRFSSPRVTPVNSEEPGKEKISDNASRETSEVPKPPRGIKISKE
ncbi:Sorting nexin-14 [Dirofilaria immitis]